MKKILLFTLAVLALTTCKTKEQRVAEDYLKKHMKCPSTFKLVEYTQTDYPEEEKREALYHISNIEGKKNQNGLYTKESVQVVYIDSIRESVATIYDHSICRIVFDAQNLMGATMRDEATIVVELGGIPYFYEDWLDMINRPREFQPAEAAELMVEELGFIVPPFLKVGEWINRRDLCKYGEYAQPIK